MVVITNGFVVYRPTMNATWPNVSQIASVQYENISDDLKSNMTATSCNPFDFIPMQDSWIYRPIEQLNKE
jgi:hypothetical protein